MRKGLRGLVDDALSRTGPLAVEKSGDFPTARPFAHQLHQALFGSDKIPESQNQSYHRSADRNWPGSTYQRTFSVQTNGATSFRVVGDAFVVSPQRVAGLLQYHPMRFWGLGRVFDTTNDVEDIDRQLQALRAEWER